MASGVSVVNALSSETIVEVARNKELYRQYFSRVAKRWVRSKSLGLYAEPARARPSVVRHPTPDIFGEMNFKPARLHRLARSKAYLFAGVEIRWKCAGELIDR